MRELAVVLASGGMDSCVTATLARRDYDLAMLHIGYGQRTQKREERAFHDIADALGARIRLVTHMDHLQVIGGSSLTDPSMVVSDAKLGSSEIPTSYVPFRNAHLLAIATSWAEVLGARPVFLGAVEEDSSGYPDCRQAFIEAFNQVIERGTRPKSGIHVRTPLIHLNKEQIVRCAAECQAPLHLSWSCYRNEEKACGTCDSCALRLRGFWRAGLVDPLPYQSDSWRSAYP